jgi:hypothetical protein
LDQFLDTWAGLIDYIIKNGKLPNLVQDLVNLGFELYSTKDSDNTTPTIPAAAFEKLFQKMKLDGPSALMAHQALTEVCVIFFVYSLISLDACIFCI